MLKDTPKKHKNPQLKESPNQQLDVWPEEEVSREFLLSSMKMQELFLNTFWNQLLEIQLHILNTQREKP